MPVTYPVSYTVNSSYSPITTKTKKETRKCGKQSSNYNTYHSYLKRKSVNIINNANLNITSASTLPDEINNNYHSTTGSSCGSGSSTSSFGSTRSYLKRTTSNSSFGTNTNYRNSRRRSITNGQHVKIPQSNLDPYTKTNFAKFLTYAFYHIWENDTTVYDDYNHDPCQILNYFQHNSLSNHHPNFDLFEDFCEKILSVSGTSFSICLVTLKLIQRLHQKNKDVNGSDGFEFRIMMAAYIIASKFYTEQSLSNAVWQEICGMDIDQLNIMEVEMLFGLCFHLNISCEEFIKWAEHLDELFTQSYLTSVWYNREIKVHVFEAMEEIRKNLEKLEESGDPEVNNYTTSSMIKKSSSNEEVEEEEDAKRNEENFSNESYKLVKKDNYCYRKNSCVCVTEEEEEEEKKKEDEDHTINNQIKHSLSTSLNPITSTTTTTTTTTIIINNNNNNNRDDVEEKEALTSSFEESQVQHQMASLTLNSKNYNAKEEDFSFESSISTTSSSVYKITPSSTISTHNSLNIIDKPTDVEFVLSKEKNLSTSSSTMTANTNIFTVEDSENDYDSDDFDGYNNYHQSSSMFKI